MSKSFRKRGLFPKMFLTYTIIIAMSFILTATILSIWFQNYYKNQRKNQLRSQSQFIIPASQQFLEGEITVERMNEYLSQIGQYINTDILVTDNYGYVYGVSNNEDAWMEIQGKQLITKDLEELRLFHEVETSGTYKGAFKHSANTFIIPIKYKGSFQGAIMMNSPIDEMMEPLNRVYMIIWISAMFAIIISSVVIYYFSQKIIISPLEEINYAAGKISKGEVQRRVLVNSNDEIGELSKSFNTMADSLEAIDKNRREFISNVSHEIRSPITSIKGFIGAILDGVIPEEKQNYYLSLTYDEIQRLTRLVNDLLDLSSIESGQLKLNMGTLDINELIRITVIKFETKIKAKNINVDVCFEGDALYVLGDRDRIIQIVTNLVDNAVKYVDMGGNINISTKKKAEKILISVFNDGPSIPQEDITHIFDRFYKVDKSRTTKSSTGLGLAIVRNILTAFGEDIWVDNNPSKGVTFTFSLKKASNNT